MSCTKCGSPVVGDNFICDDCRCIEGQPEPPLPKDEPQVMKYNSPYQSEITYRCDKNFLVRLKAFVDRNMREVGYKTSGDIFHTLLEKLNDAEDYLFESKVKTPSPVKESSPSDCSGQEKLWYEAIEVVMKNYEAYHYTSKAVKELMGKYSITSLTGTTLASSSIGVVDGE